MHKPVLLLIFFLISISCKDKITSKKADDLKETLQLTDQEVILDLEYSSMYVNWGSKSTSTSITAENYKSIKKVIQQSINNGNLDFLYSPSLDTVFNSYCIQYIPYINDLGEKFVYVNAFCRVPGEENPSGEIQTVFDWHKYFISVHDGGPCYWSVKDNLETKTYTDFGLNAQA